MAAYEYSFKHNAFTKFCSGCQNDFVGDSTEEESQSIFKKFFDTNKRINDGFQGYCKDCTKRQRRARKGVNIEGLDEQKLFERQEEKCAICLIMIYLPYRYPCDPQGARVDHDHNTGRVRGLLCHTCNSMLGIYEAILERHPEFDFDTVDKYIRGQ